MNSSSISTHCLLLLPGSPRRNSIWKSTGFQQVLVVFSSICLRLQLGVQGQVDSAATLSLSPPPAGATVHAPWQLHWHKEPDQNTKHLAGLPQLPSIKCPDEVVPRAPWISKNIILPTNFISVRNQSHMLLPTPGHWLEKQEERERSADALH